jgi:aminoglycoside phosphotransferase (APT) family kinase protein
MVTISLSSPLAAGRQAEVYPWSSGHVLKLFRTGGPDAVDYEFQKAQLAYQQGARTPQPFEMLEVEGRWGIVFDRVPGQSLWSVLDSQPWRLIELAQQFASLHHSVHSGLAPAFSPANPALAEAISQRPELSPVTKEAVLKLLARLPEGDNLLHGDFHPNNIIAGDKTLTIVDWPNAARGFPLADVARSSIIIRLAHSPAVSAWRRAIENALVDLFRRSYLRAYFQHSPYAPSDLGPWEVVLAAHRLEDGISNETESLVNFVEQRLPAYQ